MAAIASPLPAFSVVMPAHRADDHLVQALRSVEAAMAGHDAELIVVANGAAREQVAALARQTTTRPDTRIELTPLRSLVHALNRGIELARGEFVARFDADDLCLPDRFARQLQRAREGDAAFVFCAASVIDGDGVPTGERRASSTALWRRCGPIHSTAFMRRQVLLDLGGYGNLEFSEDYHLWLRAVEAGHRLAADTGTAVQYRVHGAQATAAAGLEGTFATNVGIKLTLALRGRRPQLLLGAAADLASWLVRRCRNAS